MKTTTIKFLLIIVIVPFIVTGCDEETVEQNWYKGDLHAHSTESDGDTDVAGVIELAEEKGFDYFVLTDHNTNSQWSHPGYTSDSMTLLYGVEWTTATGHANIWSNQPFDWDYIVPTLENDGDAQEAIQRIHLLNSDDQTLLFSINHPNAIGNTWDFSLEESWDADCMEVWNAGYDWPNFNFWSVEETHNHYVEMGKKIIMVGGSDSHKHDPDDIQTIYHDLGIPTTWILAESSDAHDIIKGIKAGHVFISHSPKGPQLKLLADADGIRSEHNDYIDYEVMMGDSIPAEGLNKPVRFRVKVVDARMSELIVGSSLVIVYKNGSLFKYKIYLKENYDFDFTDTPVEGDYYRAELRMITLDNNLKLEEYTQPSNVKAITNPIYTW